MRLLLTYCCGLILYLLSTNTFASDPNQPDIAALTQQIKVLTTRVNQLEARVEKCAAAPVNQKSAASPEPQPNVSTQELSTQENNTRKVLAEISQQKQTNQDNWQKLSTGLDREKVKTLIGAPTRIITLNGNEVWYYDYPNIGIGSVIFGSHNTVIGQQTPPFTGGFGF